MLPPRPRHEPGSRRAGPTAAAWLPLLLLLSSALLPFPSASGTVAPCDDDCGWFRGDDVRLDRFTAHVDVHDQLANTTLGFAFHDDQGTGQEVRFVIPLPVGASLTAFALDTGDKVLVGMVQERAQARQTYEEAQAAGEDAVLLEQADDDALRLSVHVPAEAERTLTVSYLTQLDVLSGARTYRLETSGLTALQHPVPLVELALDVYSSNQIEAFSLTGAALDVTVDQPGHVHAQRTYRDVDEMDDLVAVWLEGDGVWSSTLVTSVSPSGPGADDAAFLASIHYRPDNATVPLPRDIVFVLDTSGSMGGNKIVQARESIREVLLGLRPDDRFGMVLFSNEANVLTPELQPAAGSDVADMRARLNDVEAQGGTNLDAGVQEALALLEAASPGRVPIVVLLSDGHPTAGITSHAQIVARLHAANTAGAAVHVIAIGLDADDSFLEDMAGQSGGTLTMMLPGDDLQDRLADFYATLEDPLLTDVRVMVEGVTHSGLYPKVMPSLYRDDTLRVVFRADVADAAGLYVRIIGLGSDGLVDERFAFGTASRPVVPEVDLVWGAAHVDALLAQERKEGTDDTLRAAIVGNATTYGIVTPYTSWVIAESVVQGAPSDPQDAGIAYGTSVPQTTRDDASGDTAAPDPSPPARPNVPSDPIANGSAADDVPGEAVPTPGPGMVAILALALLAAVVRRRHV